MEWKEPPAPKAGVSRKQDIDAMVAELKVNPGQWALVAKNSPANPAPWKKKGCEVKTLRAGLGYRPGRFDMYVRWPEGGK